MRDLSLVSQCILLLALAVPAGLAFDAPAVAQTQGNQQALDALGPTKPAGAPAPHAHRVPAHHAHAVQPAAAKSTTTAPPLPVIPAAPPPIPVIKAPLINVPLHPEPPPPPVPVVAAATGAGSAIQGGSRITFGNGSADLNAAMMQSLQAFAAQLKTDPDARAQIDAYSSGTPDDPSTPRRMSLARGLAARAVLINSGIPSTRIYVRAIGQPHDNLQPDRIDLIRSDSTQPAPDPAAGPGKVANLP